MTLGTPGTIILSLALSLFALSTILGWYWYAETALVYLFNNPSPIVLKPFKLFWIILIVLGGWGGAGVLTDLWDLSDTLNGLMAVPNLIGLLLLTKQLKKVTDDFDAKIASGELKK